MFVLELGQAQVEGGVCLCVCVCFRLCVDLRFCICLCVGVGFGAGVKGGLSLRPLTMKLPVSTRMMSQKEKGDQKESRNTNTKQRV